MASIIPIWLPPQAALKEEAGASTPASSRKRFYDPFRDCFFSEDHSSNSIKEAFAVKGDKFLAVGTSSEMRALAGPQTQLVDLGGRAAMPGLMDNHNHAYKHRKYKTGDMRDAF